MSVNAHGWQVGSSPIASTIVAMTVVTTEGEIKKITQANDPELFQAIIGGYGMFGIIINVDLKTLPNSNLKFNSTFIKTQEFEMKFKHYVTDNPEVELAYGRLSVDQFNLFEEVCLFWYEKMRQQSKIKKNRAESLIAVKRGIFRISQYFNFGKKLRWSTEKIYARKTSFDSSLSRNNAMNTEISIFYGLYMAIIKISCMNILSPNIS